MLIIGTDTNTGIGATLKYGFSEFGKFSGRLAFTTVTGIPKEHLQFHD